MYRVLIADDHADVREAIADLIGEEDDMDLVAASVDATAAIEMAERFRPDVAILDVHMPNGGGWEAARKIHASLPGIRLIAHSAHDQSLTIRTMRAVGIGSYVVKGGDLSVLLAAVRGEPVPEVTSRPSESLIDAVRRAPGFAAESNRQGVD